MLFNNFRQKIFQSPLSLIKKFNDLKKIYKKKFEYSSINFLKFLESNFIYLLNNVSYKSNFFRKVLNIRKEKNCKQWKFVYVVEMPVLSKFVFLTNVQKNEINVKQKKNIISFNYIL